MAAARLKTSGDFWEEGATTGVRGQLQVKSDGTGDDRSCENRVFCLCRIAGASAEAEDEVYERGVAESNCVYRLQENRLVPEEQAWASVPSVSLLGSSEVARGSSHLWLDQRAFFWFSRVCTCVCVSRSCCLTSAARSTCGREETFPPAGGAWRSS